MTVQDLKTELDKYDSDLPVVIEYPDDYGDVMRLIITDVDETYDTQIEDNVLVLYYLNC